MPQFIKMDLFTLPTPEQKGKLAILCTTNGCVHTKSNALVMGRGAAQAMCRAAGNSRKQYAANNIREKVKQGKAKLIATQGIFEIYEYELCYMGDWQGIHLGGFQVKYHFSEKARLSRIERASWQLHEVALKFPTWIFRMNYPGIGAGGLTRKEVEPFIEGLPANVHIVTF